MSLRVVIAGWGQDGRGVTVRGPIESTIFTPSYCPDRLWGPPSLLSNGYRGLSSAVKRLESEAVHSPPTRAEVKKTWIHTSTFPYSFTVYC
jgi:hypothetical protein